MWRLTLDPGRVTGWAVWSRPTHHSEWILSASGTLRWRATQDGDEICRIQEQVRTIIANCHGLGLLKDIIAESVVLLPGRASSRAASIRGDLHLTAWLSGVVCAAFVLAVTWKPQIHFVTATEWKGQMPERMVRATVGRWLSGAGYRVMLQTPTTSYATTLNSVRQHEADAIGIGLSTWVDPHRFGKSFAYRRLQDVL